VINGFGETVIGAFSATSQIEALIQQPYVALAFAMVTYAGQNTGAGNTDRIKMGMRASVKITFIYSIILIAIFWPAANYIMRIFVPERNIIDMASIGIRITSLCFIALGMTWILRYLLNGAGDSIFSMFNGVIDIVGRVGLAIVLTHIAFIGVWGIWVTTSLTWIITMCFALWRYKSGAWMSKSLVNQKETYIEAAGISGL
jgi:Na+-driven multidrug efflux pump